MADVITTATPPPVRKRGAIVGTASSYKLTPWDDHTLDIFGLNDGYALPHMKRATGWFDLHPIAEMVFRQGRVVQAASVPAGAYLRPEGHLHWLKSRSFPVYLRHAPPAGWPAHVQAFPFDAIRASHGNYFSSTPAWMLAWMLDQGYTEIHIYGIHLATEWEYVQQRPNFEFLIGMALARGVQFVIPDQSPLLKGKHLYALEPKPSIALDAIQTRIATMKDQGRRWHQEIAARPWYARSAKSVLVSRVRVLDLELLDARQEQARLAALSAVM